MKSNPGVPSMLPVSGRSMRYVMLLIVLCTGCQQYEARAPLPPGKTANPPEYFPAEEQANAEKKNADTTVDGVKLDVVKFADLEKAIASHPGKVIVLDLWATWCVPCKAEFHHLVELHEKYAKEGVVCISISLDEADAKDSALSFLKSKKALFTNYLVDDEESKWQDKWGVGGIPIVFVHGKDGKRIKRFDNSDPDNQFTYKQVEELVKELLAKK
jgi:thiol-disulfide isomerase/thioredoxin